MANADACADDAEALASDVFIAAEDDDSARAHVFLFTDNRRNSFVTVVSESLGRMFEKAGFMTGLAGRHGGRKVDKPFGVGGEATHHFESGHGVFSGDSDVVLQAGADEAFAGDVGEVEKVVVDLLGAEGRRRRLGRKRLGAFIVGVEGGDGDEFFLWIAESGELAAVDAAGVNVDGAVEPLGFGNGSVAVYDDGLAAIIAGPVVADGQAEIVNFAGGFAEEGKVANRRGAAALHFLLHAGMSDDETAAIENVMADESVEKFCDLLAEFRRLFLELREGLDNAMG